MATFEKTHIIYTEQMLKSSMTSSRGKNIVLIMYVYDSNAILA